MGFIADIAKGLSQGKDKDTNKSEKEIQKVRRAEIEKMKALNINIYKVLSNPKYKEFCDLLDF